MGERQQRINGIERVEFRKWSWLRIKKSFSGERESQWSELRRTRVNQKGRIGSRRERVATSSNGVRVGTRCHRGVAHCSHWIMKADWTPPRRAPSLSPGIEVLIRRKWRVFNRDNTLTMRGIPNAFAAALARPLESSLPLAIVVSPRSKGVTHNA